MGGQGRERGSLCGGGGRAKGKRGKRDERWLSVSLLSLLFLLYLSSSLVSCSWEEEASTAARKEAKSSFAFAS